MELPAGLVALVLTDIEGSTAAWDADPEAMETQMRVHDDAVAEAIAAAGGVLLKTKGEGDSTFSVFAEPLAAVLCAGDLLVRLEERAFSLPVRVAVHVGDVEPRGNDYFGPVPNRTARLRGLARGGQVLVSGAAAAAVGDRLPPGLALVDLGVHELRGLSRPEHVFGLAHPALSDVEAIDEPPPPPGNLPTPVDRFIGRDEDRVLLDKALRHHRIVTVVGPGGIGKSRLALQVAAEQAGDRPGGTWIVDVGNTVSGDQLAADAAAVLGLDESGHDPLGAVVTALVRPALVLLDTCEAQIDAAAELAAALVGSAPAITVLATSREPLDVPGEAVLRLDPLDLDLDGDAVALFLERASASTLGGGTVDRELAQRVCEATDGVPLAIELVAGRLASEDAADLERAVASLDALIGPDAARRRTGPARQRSVSDALAWSIEPLSTHERALLSRLTVFSGGWSEIAALDVCAGEGLSAADVAAGHASLLRRSLAVRDRSGLPRHRLLDMVREYVRRHEPPPPSSVEARHLDWSTRRAEELCPDAGTPTETGTRAEYLAEQPNFRSALAAAVAGRDADRAHRLVYAQADVWQAMGALAEGRRSADEALSIADTPELRGAGLAVAAFVRFELGEDEDEAAAMIDDALELLPHLPAEIACDVRNLATSSSAYRDDPPAILRSYAEAAVDFAREHAQPAALAVALNNLSVVRSDAPWPVRQNILEEAADVERVAHSSTIFGRLGLVLCQIITLDTPGAAAVLAEVRSHATDPANEEEWWGLRCEVAAAQGDEWSAREAAEEHLRFVVEYPPHVRRSPVWTTSIAQRMLEFGHLDLAHEIAHAIALASNADAEAEEERIGFGARWSLRGGDVATARALVEQAAIDGPWSYVHLAHAEVLIAEDDRAGATAFMRRHLPSLYAVGNRAAERRLLRVLVAAQDVPDPDERARLNELDALAAGTPVRET